MLYLFFNIIIQNKLCLFHLFAVDMRTKTIYSMIMFKINLQSEEKNVLIISECDYYVTPNARALCHDFKKGSKNSLNIIAEALSKYVAKGDILVPIPSRNGVATNTLDLTLLIVEITSAVCFDVLEGVSRASVYDLKQNNKKLDNGFFGFYTAEPPPDNKVILIDAVFDTGSTIKAASEHFSECSALVYAASITKK
jgi:predicted amidophosphoribosyltransferase